MKKEYTLIFMKCVYKRSDRVVMVKKFVGTLREAEIYGNEFCYVRDGMYFSVLTDNERKRLIKMLGG